MKLITDFQIMVDNARILEVLKCSAASPVYEQTLAAILEAEAVLNQSAELWCGYATMPVEDPFTTIESFKNSDTLYMGALTIGDKIAGKVQNLFDQGEYLEATILDLASDQLLFQMGSQVQKELNQSLFDTSLVIAKMLYPGDEGLDLSHQKTIINTLEKQAAIPVEVMDSLMLKPVKSLSFIAFAEPLEDLSLFENQCQSCKQTECLFREVDHVTLSVMTDQGVSRYQHPVHESLYQTLVKNNFFHSPCGGKGTCGKCIIWLQEGSLAPSESDHRFFTESEMKKGYRLACCAYPVEDVSISLEQATDENFQIITRFSLPPIERASRVYRFQWPVNQKGSVSPMSYTEEFPNQIVEETVNTLKSLRTLSALLTQDPPPKELAGYRWKNQLIDLFLPEEKRDGPYGIAIDIGTTTIASVLVHMNSGRVLSQYATANRQRSIGADVITRIQYASENREHLSQLATLARKDLWACVETLCHNKALAPGDVCEVVVTGNTTMLHLLMELNPSTMGSAPFLPITVEKQEMLLKDLLGFGDTMAMVTLLPGISAFVGSDLLMGILNTEMDKSEEVTLLMDVGTNGEMAIGNENRIISLSTAAGPAFEGARIKQGVPSIPGAINRVEWKDDKAIYTTISGKKPIGICGSGVIDVVGEGLKNNLIEPSGRLAEGFREGIVITEGSPEDRIVFTQKDIREVQLAKSAIRTGIDMLIQHYGCHLNDVKRFVLAGGFGNHARYQHLVSMGLIPEVSESKVSAVGNAALGGAVAYLLSTHMEDQLYGIIEKTEYIEIASQPEFMDRFVENMSFGESL